MEMREYQTKADNMAAEIRELNEAQLRKYTPVPKGMTLNLPGSKTYQVPADTTLVNVAKEKLGSEDNDKVRLLFDINSDRLKLPAGLPVGTEMKMPSAILPH